MRGFTVAFFLRSSALPGPDNGVDGFTLALADCECVYDPSRPQKCACCQNNGCQCGPEHRNQCVDCSHLEHCGSKPWIFGPPMPVDP